MDQSAHVSAEALIEIARRQGIVLDSERARELVPRVESLLARLARVADGLPQEFAPAPGGPPRRRP